MKNKDGPRLSSKKKKLVGFQIFAALESTPWFLPQLYCHRSFVEQESVARRKWIPSAFFSLKGPHGADAGSPYADRLNPSSVVVHLGTCGFSGRLRTLRQANNRCSLPAHGATCLDFHTYTSW